MTKVSRFAVLFAGLIGFAPVIYGQESSDASNEDEAEQPTQIMELVEVTATAGYRVNTASSATGLNVPLDELPVNIQVISSEVVQDFQLLSQRDALQFSSSVDDKRVRGFNTGEFFRNGFIYLSDTPGYTIDRMEILMGPSAVLNGPVTPGGAVNIITKKPLDGENFGHVEGFWGISDGRNNAGGNIDFNGGATCRARC